MHRFNIINSFINNINIFRAARQYWQKHLFEYFNVDSSSCMNDLALKLLQEGRDNKAPVIKGVFHRQFLPATKVIR